MLYNITDSRSPYPFQLTAPFLTIAILLSWIVPGLLGHDPWKPDEAYTVGLILHILETGDWVVPTLAGEPFMEKPPIYFLTAAFFAELFSFMLPMHDAARLASGFFMALTFLFTGLAAKELTGKQGLWMAPLLLVACPGLPERMHQMITDTALLSGFALAFYGLSLSIRRPGAAGLWLGSGIGLGFMAKGLLAPGIIGIAALTLPLTHQQWRGKRYFLVLLYAFFALLPWLLIWPTTLYFQSELLFHDWFWINNLGRFLGTNDLGPTKGSGYYVKTLLWSALPVWPIALVAFFRRKNAVCVFSQALLLPVVYFLIIFTVLTISSDARQLYSLPLLLPLSVMAVPGLQQLPDAAVKLLARSGILIFSSAILVLWLAAFVIAFKYPEFAFTRVMAIKPEITFDVSWGLLIIAALFTSFWALLIRWNVCDAVQALVNWSAGITLVWLLMMTLLLPTINDSKSFHSVMTDLGQHLPADDSCLSSRNLGEPQRAMLHYYLDRYTYRQESKPRRRNCDYLLIQYRQDMLAAVNTDIERWQNIWSGRRPGDTGEFYVLYKAEPDVNDP